MASLWTPEGEHRVPKDDETTGDVPASSPMSAFETEGELDDAQIQAMQEEMAQLEQELLSAPVEAIIANHCYGFFQLAALHLSQRPPHLNDARLAIDALAAVVDVLDDRLGPAKETLDDALAQIRLAYVQISAAETTTNGTNGDTPPIAPQ